jgi:putative ABC transport system substrate-binding protein
LALLAAKRATASIPIVMTDAGDPLGSGLIASLARPSGNITGLNLMTPDLAGKRVEMLKELLPTLSQVVDPAAVAPAAALMPQGSSQP